MSTKVSVGPTFVRRPTNEEVDLLANYFTNEKLLNPTEEGFAEELEGYRELIVNTSVAVFPNYITDSTEYSDGLLMINFETAPGDVEVFTLVDGVLTKVATSWFRGCTEEERQNLTRLVNPDDPTGFY